MDAANPAAAPGSSTAGSGVDPAAYKQAAEDAAGQGRTAYGMGLPITTCPYGQDDPMRVVWVRSYVAAQQTRGAGQRIEPPGRTG